MWTSLWVFIYLLFYLLICSEILSVQKDKFRLKWNNEQNIQISIFTGKHLWWRSFMYSCKYEGLQLYEKMTPSQMFSCETCELLHNIIFKENCWVATSDFKHHFWCIASFISNKSTCLGLPETTVHKRQTVFALKIFKDNQNITKVDGNVLLMRSTQQRNWPSRPERISHYYEILAKITGKHLCRSPFLGCRPATSLKKILMNKRFTHE